MKWALNQSKEHIEAWKEILSSSTYHLTTIEPTGLRKALAILEPFVNLRPLLGHRCGWRSQAGSRKMCLEERGMSGPQTGAGHPMHFLNSSGPPPSGSVWLPSPWPSFPLCLLSPTASVLLCFPCTVTFPACFVEAQSLLLDPECLILY